MILTDSAIRDAMARGTIEIDPFDPAALGPNSYDVHLSQHFGTYGGVNGGFEAGVPLDCREEPWLDHWEAGEHGVILKPGILYLAVTVERTKTTEHIPYLDGKSSIGRLGIFIHTTAGRGDVGFDGHWTMEITVVHPVKVYVGMPIGQLTFHQTVDIPACTYDRRTDSKYTDAATDPRPQPSRMWRNFRKAQ